MEPNPDVTIEESDEDKETELTEEDLKRMREAANLTCGKDQSGRRRGFSAGGPSEVNNHNN